MQAYGLRFHPPKIVIIGYFRFPYGSAAATRVRNLSMGLFRLGASVTVITQIPISAMEAAAERHLGGVRYYSSSRTSHSRNLVEKLHGYLSSINESASLLKLLIDRKEVDQVILYTHTFVSGSPIIKLCQRNNIPVIADVVEWLTPEGFLGGILDPQYHQVVLKRSILDRKLSGVLVTSKYLEEKYAEYNIPTLRIPALYDFDEHSLGSPNMFTRNVELTFVGGNKKNDGLQDAIRAVKRIRQDNGRKGESIRLTIVGDLSGHSNVSRIRDRLKDDRLLRDVVIFRGKLSEDDYYHQLDRSDILLLPRRDDKMARAAFPTRLPEFLSTGRPVITTSVPDVPEYATDRLHAHVVEPQRPDLVAERILEIVEAPRASQLLGLAGRAQSIFSFDYQSGAKKVLDLISAL